MKVSTDNMVNGSFFHRSFKVLLFIAAVLLLMHSTSHLWCTHFNYNDNAVSSFSLTPRKYPLTDPIPIPNGMKYPIAVISDLDKDRSKVPGKAFAHRSYMKTGYLIQEGAKFRIELTNTRTLTSTLNEKGRGLELSELCMFNKKLYTVDDRTGVVFELYSTTSDTKEKLSNTEPIPWVILQDGGGHVKKGFKCEWMTVKGGLLYVGSMGKERTTSSGEFENLNPMFVKTIDAGGQVRHHNWTDHYRKVRSKVGIKFPGYILHEAVMWSEVKRRWFFLPRRMSKLKYDEVLDETRNANVLLSASEDFSDIDVVYVEKHNKKHGFSSFKFIPGTQDNLLLGLKTNEVGDDVSSYAVVVEVPTGKVIMDEQLIMNEKFEGVEFL